MMMIPENTPKTPVVATAPRPAPAQPSILVDGTALARTMIDETYNSSVQGINTGFALATALAWNDTVKVVIQKFIKSNANVAQMHVVYALVVTILSAIVFVITKKFLKPSFKKTDVAPVLLR
jgi:hypothetical protein